MKYIILMTILSFLLVNNAAALTPADMPSGSKRADWSRDDVVRVCAGYARNESFDDVLWVIEHYELEVPSQGYWTAVLMNITLAKVRALRTGDDVLFECIDEVFESL